MATFYIGKRPVLKGRSSNVTNVYTGKVGKYSNWNLQNPSHVLDGFPDRAVTPGRGAYPHGVQMSRWFAGDHQITPMRNPGDGARLDPHYFRQQPLTYKGLVSTQALAGPHFGHAHGVNGAYARFSNWSGFKGVTSANATLNAGHAQRAYGAGPANMGPTAPFVFHGVNTPDSRPLKNPGRTYADGRYGFEKPREWAGIPAAKAL